MLGLQPILLEELEASHSISLEGVGMVATAEIFALGVGVALSDALLSVSRLKLIAAIAAALAAVVNFATRHATGDGQFVALRAAAGLAEGVLVWTATSVVVRSVNPEQLAALFLAVSTAAQAVVAALLWIAVVPRGGWQGGFGLLAALSGLCAVFASGLPQGLAPLQSPGAEKLRWNVARLLPLGIAFLQLAALVSLFAYLEPLAKAVGHGSGAGFVTWEVLMFQVLGGVAATRAIQRFRPVSTLGTGTAVLAALAVGIRVLPAGATASFTLLCAILGFTWLFLLPFQVALAFRADAKGRVAMLVPSAQLIGSALGPLAASAVVTEDDPHAVPLVSLAFALLAGALVIAVWRLRVDGGVEALAAVKETG
jgi:predicted MFS family arabinose efflux permease